MPGLLATTKIMAVRSFNIGWGWVNRSRIMQGIGTAAEGVEIETPAQMIERY